MEFKEEGQNCKTAASEKICFKRGVHCKIEQQGAQFKTKQRQYYHFGKFSDKQRSGLFITNVEMWKFILILEILYTEASVCEQRLNTEYSR